MDIETARNESGEIRVGHKLTAEEFETLKALNSSPYWKPYRELLIRTKDAYFNSMLALNDTNQILKTMGMIAGLNIAVNQLPVLCAEYAKEQQKELEKDSKQSVPFRRG